VVKHLPSKCEALGSNCSTSKKKEKKKQGVGEPSDTTSISNFTLHFSQSCVGFFSATIDETVKWHLTEGGPPVFSFEDFSFSSVSRETASWLQSSPSAGAQLSRVERQASPPLVGLSPSHHFWGPRAWPPQSWNPSLEHGSCAQSPACFLWQN
jgi:hypothetical protein